MGEGKSIPMHTVKKEETATANKMSYEQLENIAHQLSEQNRQLHTDLLKSQEFNFFKRLDYLFKVIENPGGFTNDFYSKCQMEIETLMTIPEETSIEESNINKD